MRIPLGVLTYKRPDYLKRTLESFFHVNYDCLKVFKPFVVMSQGHDKATENVLKQFEDKIDRVIRLRANHGCAWGYSYLNYELIEEDTDLVMHLQDDWLSTEPLTNYLSMDEFSGYARSYGIKELFEMAENVGYIRLRSNIWSKVAIRHRITEKAIKWRLWETKYKKYGRIHLSNAHYTLNPTIIRTSVLKQILPVTEELDAMLKYHELKMRTAQLRANCFMHIGHDRAMTVLKTGKKRWVR
jgi:hypothetical protein